MTLMSARLPTASVPRSDSPYSAALSPHCFLIARSNDNLKALEQWVAKTPWAGFLAKDAVIRSNTSVCIAITDPAFVQLAEDAKAEKIKKMCSILEKEGAALDIAGYRAAPPGLRIWCGATVDTADIEALAPWLDWAWRQVKG